MNLMQLTNKGIYNNENYDDSEINLYKQIK